MPNSPAADTWTRAGTVALPLYGVLLFFGTLTPQPDQTIDPEAWARFVSRPSYLVVHVLTNVVGSVLVILGTFCLGALLVGRAPRLALSGLLLSIIGQVLFTVPGTVSTFVTPAIGQAYLRGTRDVMTVEFPDAMTLVVLVGLLAVVVGDVLLGVAVVRSRVFARWTGIAFLAGVVTFYLLGFALGSATTGASLPTQPVGAAVLVAATGAMAWTAVRRRDAREVGTVRGPTAAPPA